MYRYFMILLLKVPLQLKKVQWKIFTIIYRKHVNNVSPTENAENYTPTENTTIHEDRTPAETPAEKTIAVVQIQKMIQLETWEMI